MAVDSLHLINLLESASVRWSPGCNAVTVESEHMLFQWQDKLGGTLTRIAIQRAEPVGIFLGWKAMAPVTAWV